MTACRGLCRNLAALAVTVAALTGCGDPLVGAYRDDAGAVTYELQDQGRAYITVLGTTVAASYTTDDCRVIVTSPQGTTVLTRDANTLRGPMGLVLHRVPDPELPFDAKRHSASQKDS